MGLTSRVRGGIVETPRGLETVARAASNAADAVGIKTMELRHASADARMVENDWRKIRKAINTSRGCWRSAGREFCIAYATFTRRRFRKFWKAISGECADEGDAPRTRVKFLLLRRRLCRQRLFRCRLHRDRVAFLVTLVGRRNQADDVDLGHGVLLSLAIYHKFARNISEC